MRFIRYKCNFYMKTVTMNVFVFLQIQWCAPRQKRKKNNSANYFIHDVVINNYLDYTL